MKLYTVKELAVILQVTERTVRNYLADGSLRYLKIGRNIRVKQEQLDQFLEGSD